ncbi:hypothetical protein GGX14DRAFT_609573 [Mycena pura]|uniref:Uncharacterized protein n=1 Tax=Mycena pura TaxID=153505 RepID=A0AAD6VJE2_9AGAR|nr:hypothetical protein GGX14DRAFT_609573 [Mycena pura]
MNGLWKLATDAAEAVSPHANSALNAVKSGQILPEEQVDAAKRAAEAVGRASAGAAVATGAVLAAHANNAFNAIKSVPIPNERLDAAAAIANQAAVGAGNVAADVHQRIASLDPDTQRKIMFVGGGIAVGLVAPPLILNAVGFTPGGVAAGSAAAGIHAGIGNVAAGSVFAGLQSVGVLGLGPGAGVVAGLGGAAGHFLDELTKKKRDSKL